MSETVEVEGREILLTHLDKVLWEREKITKAELIHYYATIASHMLPFLRDRPLSVSRFPHGIEGGLSFVQKNWPHKPDWVKAYPIKSESGKKVVNYVVCNDLPTLIWLANMTAVEINQFFSRIPKVDHPDTVLFDFDPKYPAEFAQAKEVAYAVHVSLRELGLEHMIKTSGSDGLHILVPVKPHYSEDKIRSFVKRVGDIVESLMPRKLTTSTNPSDQAGKIYLDYRQNGLRRVIASPFSVRPLPGAPVSFPVKPEALLDSAMKPENFSLRFVPKLTAKRKPERPVAPQSLEKAFGSVGL